MDINSQTDNGSINNDTTIHFPEGLLGFNEFRDYRLFNSNKEKDLHWLQPVNSEEIEFAVTLPSVFQVDYEVTLDEDEEKTLDIQDGDEVVVLVTLSKNQDDDPQRSCLNANFIAPIVINTTKQLGLQKVLNHQENPVTITMRG
jgi:flagellar assembly factor FliW